MFVQARKSASCGKHVKVSCLLCAAVQVQNAFFSGALQVIVATIAFGEHSKQPAVALSHTACSGFNPMMCCCCS